MLSPGSRLGLIQVQRGFSGRGKGAQREPALGAVQQAERRCSGVQIERPPTHLPVEALQRAVQHVALGEAATNARGRVEARAVVIRATTASRGLMVEITVGEHDALDGRVALRARVELVEALYLLADLGGRVEQKPRVAVSANRYRLLSA